MDISSLYKLCDLYSNITKYSAEIISQLQSSVKNYEKTRNVHLVPGPTGTQGQIFFIKETPDRVVKLTTDESEAFNMNEVKILQQKEKSKLKKLFDGIVTIFDISKINPPGTLPVYAIEQEKGINLNENKNLYKYVKQILFITGPTMRKNRDEDIDSILEELENHPSKKLQMLGLTNKKIRNHIDPAFKDIVPSNMVYVPHPKDRFDSEVEEGHPSDPDFLSDVDRKLKGKIKMIDLGYGSPRTLKL